MHSISNADDALFAANLDLSFRQETDKLYVSYLFELIQCVRWSMILSAYSKHVHICKRSFPVTMHSLLKSIQKNVTNRFGIA